MPHAADDVPHACPVVSQAEQHSLFRGEWFIFTKHVIDADG